MDPHPGEECNLEELPEKRPEKLLEQKKEVVKMAPDVVQLLTDLFVMEQQ